MSIKSLDKNVPGLGARALLSLSVNDFKRRYASSALGGVWAFVSPLLTLSIYWLVFNFIFKQTPIEGVPYGLWLIAGTLPWLFISEGIMGITTAYTDYSFLIAKVRFRTFYLPKIRMFTPLLVHIILIIMSGIVFAFYGITPDIMLMYFIFSAVVFVYATGRITALLQVYMRGTAQAVSAILQLIFWITPIFWDCTALSDGTLKWLSLSPVFYITAGYRKSFFKTEAIDVTSTAIFWCICVILLIAGKLFYKAVRPTLADKVE